MVIRMISSVLHLLFKCVLYYLYFACPTNHVTDLQVLEIRVCYTPNNVFLVICLHIPYMEVNIDIECI